MGIWERLGNIARSYFSDDGRDIPWRSSGKNYRAGAEGDPDFDAAYEELEEFLRGGDGTARKPDGEKQKNSKPVPGEIRAAFAALGLTEEASAEECKAAYKKLLKIHHPDRHAKNPENIKRATEKTAGVNAAYRLLEKWFQSAARP